jgi:hypothetical protein
VYVPGHGLLGADVLFAENANLIAWGSAGGLLIFGLVCLTLRSRRQGHADAPTRVAVSEHERNRLAEAPALTSHQFAALSFLYAAGKNLILSGFLLLLGGGAVIFALASPALEGTTAAMVGLVGLLVGLLALFMASMSYREYSDRVIHIEVCPHGLRWSKKDSFGMATWAEIGGVDRNVIVTGRGENIDRSDVTTITLRNGETLRLSCDMITDYPRFANTLQSCVNEENKRVAFSLPDAALGRAFARRS